MNPITLLGFFFLTLSFLSLWIRKDPKIWASLLALSLICGTIAGNILCVGLIFIGALALLWVCYSQKPSLPLLLLLALVGIIMALHVLPGYHPVAITTKFKMGFEGSLMGLFSLALLVPLAKTAQDWKKAFQGALIGCAGIAALAILAIASHTVSWQLFLPSAMLPRLFNNLVFTSIPQEGFFRGFLQKEISRYLHDTRKGKILALLLSSLLFMSAHVYWSPSVVVLGFTFLASLLYGGVYLISGKIESAILCHFALNLAHMILFNYHAA